MEHAQHCMGLQGNDTKRNNTVPTHWMALRLVFFCLALFVGLRNGTCT